MSITSEFREYKQRVNSLNYILTTLEKERDDAKRNLINPTHELNDYMVVNNLNVEIEKYVSKMREMKRFDTRPYYYLYKQRKFKATENFKRDKDIAVSVLAGETLSSTANRHDLSQARARQLTWHVIRLVEPLNKDNLKNKRARKDILIPLIKAL